MWKDTATGNESEQPTAAGWVFWVSGWSLLVGVLAAVVPAYFVFGSHAAIWTGGGVSFLVALVTWLGAEAERAVFEDRRRSLVAARAYPAAKRVTTIH